MKSFDTILKNCDTLIEIYPGKLLSDEDPHTTIQKAKQEIQHYFITLDQDKKTALHEYLDSELSRRIVNLEILIIQNKLNHYKKIDDNKGILKLRYEQLPEFGSWINKNFDSFYDQFKTKPKKKQISLEDMFKDTSRLQEITDQLTKKSFLKEGTWQGRPDPHTGKTPKEKQLAALALVIQERKLLKKDFSDKDTAKAFLQYFQLNTKGNYFKKGSFEYELEEYKSLFAFI